MPYYKIRFEPIDIEADNPERAIRKYCEGGEKPQVRKVYLVNKDGFPLR